MPSLMADFIDIAGVWRYSSEWRNNNRLFLRPPHGTISTAEKRFVQQRTLYVVWHCDFALHRPSSGTAWLLVLYFVLCC